MKNQALFSLKDQSQKLKCRLLQFLFGTLRVNNVKLEVLKDGRQTDSQIHVIYIKSLSTPNQKVSFKNVRKYMENIKFIIKRFHKI